MRGMIRKVEERKFMNTSDTNTKMSNCPLCGAKNSSVVVCEFEGIRQCHECEFIFADPEIEWNTSYEEDFADAARHPTYVKMDGNYVIRNEFKLSCLLKKMERYRMSNRILDIGCSAAFFLKLAEKNGWEARGVEISRFGAEFSNNELGIDVFHGTLDQAGYPDAFFDVVFSSHVFEHIADPSKLLDEIYRVLRPGGAVFTLIPTQFSSPSYRFWKKLHGDPPPRHVSFYNRKTFTKFMEEAGFENTSSHYNVELNRLKELLKEKSPEDSVESTKEISAANDSPQGGYGLPIRLLKSIINPLATSLGIGDEMLAIATKPDTE